MKLNPAVMKSLLMAASIGMVVPLVVTAQTPPKPAAPKKEKAEPPPKIDGITIARKNGHFLGLTVDGVQFNLRFYDDKKKPEKPDATTAAARWNPVNVKAALRAILNPSPDGMTLVSPGWVRPPLTFHAYFTLFTADGKVIEEFSIDLNELSKPPAAAGPVKGY
ncbi:MAG: hypothetical protein WC661_18770 [Opitutaceae bacterium]|jgi:hypothetical protein